ncbi:MAG: T9SS type A sorting domain-containing protein [Bacteroidetes bacterium]|nr:MAG: T9SS type A sorting domain-containing protein [Bacteroidota bacterium]
MNRIKLLLLTVFLTVGISSKAQNVRGFYLQDVGDWLGITADENDILAYAQGNGFNYILLYDLGDINWTSTTEKNQLAAFIRKARTQYGIVQFGGVVEYSNYVTQKLLPYNVSRLDPLERFDVINLEFEFWVSSNVSYYCSKFLQAAGFPCTQAGAWDFAWREFKLIDDICAANGMMSEIYLGWPDQQQMQNLASRADRILLSAYRPTDVDIYLYSVRRMEDIATTPGLNSANVLTLMSAEPAFMGSWLNSHAQTVPFQTMNAALTAETRSFKQKINLQGYQWFTYKYLPKLNLCTPPATPVITVNGSTTLLPGQTVTLTATTAGGYLWSTGDQSQSITVGAGTYTVRTYSAANCFSTSDPVDLIELTTGISTTLADQITVHPNPATSTIFVKTDLPVELQLSDLTGRIVMEKMQSTSMDVSRMPRGLYYLSVFNGEDRSVHKIMLTE